MRNKTNPSWMNAFIVPSWSSSELGALMLTVVPRIDNVTALLLLHKYPLLMITYSLIPHSFSYHLVLVPKNEITFFLLPLSLPLIYLLGSPHKNEQPLFDRKQLLMSRVEYYFLSEDNIWIG
ncbi:hypothetical protein KP509_24G063200 [Ceratopteris richardii]|uniref:Uncharacterized protein n=1 Tax=Ceratopteris richardii TaxID=49495 RepID=A0A8T2RYE5_CERRI|nr:hypothetical protein KP509_24G063200 [Ceratopteris richardii]